jgi:FtsH-binding integral membrane protein
MFTATILPTGLVFSLLQGGVVDEKNTAYQIGRMAGMIFIVLVIVVVVYRFATKSKK